MPRFIVERALPDLTPAEIGALANGCPEDEGGVLWIRSYISESDGKVYCEFDAPSADAIRAMTEKAGWPAERISRISVQISSDMFR